MKRLRLSYQKIVLASMLVLASTTFFWGHAYAALLLDRSIQVSDSRPNAVTLHTFAFFTQQNNSVGSIVFEYCDNNPFFDDVCSAPPGLDVSGAVMDSEVGETGFSIDGSTTTNRLVLTRPPAITNIGQAQFVFSNVVNPSIPNISIYVRITLHGSTDGTGPRTDHGAVVFVTSGTLDTRAFVPPHLTFCTGITVAVDCTSANGFYIDLGELSKTSANTGTSQYSGSTNDLTGYSVTLFGTTMTSGNKTIPALASPSPSQPGISQFGVNLRDNSVPNVGQEPDGSGTALSNFTYAIPDNFKFTSGDIISSATIPTHFNRFTMSYLVNASPNQPPGIYNATFTFIATALF